MNPPRSNNFNFFRFVFATMVVVAHAPLLLDNDHRRDPLFRVAGNMDLGHLAVDLFFILSGFLIVQSWSMQPRLGLFLQKRVRRIFPGFLMASLVCALLVGPIAYGNARQYFAAFNVTEFALAALQLQKLVTPPVFQGTQLQLNGSMWTIAPEFACYLAVAAVGVLGAVRHRLGWAAITAVVVSLFCLQRFGIPAIVPDYMLRLAGCFAMGGCFYLFQDKIPKNRWFALLGLGALVVCQFSWRLSEIAVVLAAPYLLFYLGAKQSRVGKLFNDLPDISYGIYLYSFPIQALLSWKFPTASPWLLLPVAMAGAIAAGTISWYAVERPALHRPAARAVPAGTDEHLLGQ